MHCSWYHWWYNQGDYDTTPIFILLTISYNWSKAVISGNWIYWYSDEGNITHWCTINISPCPQLVRRVEEISGRRTKVHSSDRPLWGVPRGRRRKTSRHRPPISQHLSPRPKRALWPLTHLTLRSKHINCDATQREKLRRGTPILSRAEFASLTMRSRDFTTRRRIAALCFHFQSVLPGTDAYYVSHGFFIYCLTP